MKNLKSFVERHILAIAVSEVLVLGPAGICLGVVFNYFWFLLVALALLLYLLLWCCDINRDWVCAKCGEKEILGRHKFCAECGGIMHAVKHAVKRVKIFCLRGHRVSKYDKFCPKCGVSLVSKYD